MQCSSKDAIIPHGKNGFGNRENSAWSSITRRIEKTGQIKIHVNGTKEAKTYHGLEI
jgi:hypothetical protein